MAPMETQYFTFKKHAQTQSHAQKPTAQKERTLPGIQNKVFAPKAPSKRGGIATDNKKSERENIRAEVDVSLPSFPEHQGGNTAIVELDLFLLLEERAGHIWTALLNAVVTAFPQLRRSFHNNQNPP